ncbi:hypothetical protein R6Q59_000538 [Mikania micrantha]
MVGRGRVPSPKDLSSSRGRGRASDSSGGRGGAPDSGGGRGCASDSGGGCGQASDYGRGRGRASDYGRGRGRASDSGGGRGQASDSDSGRGRASVSIPGQKYILNSSRGHGRGHSSALSPEVSRTLGRGYAGSSSQVGRSDPMADMEGVLRHQQVEDFHHEGYRGSQEGFNIARDHAESLEDEEYNEEEDATHLGSNAADLPHDPSQREFISRIGEKFAKGKIHRVIRILFNESFDGPWATYRQVPKEVLNGIFDRFRTRYRWDPSNDYVIREAFQNVLKKRYPDIMLEHRSTSAKKARDAGYNCPNDKPDFNIMCDFPPRFVHPEVWRDLCMGWNTEEWKKKSKRGRNNRMSADDEDVISRHTGGSRGYDEHRIILEKKLGKPPTFKELFLATHLVKESKKKFWDGLYDESLDGAVFCTNRSRKAYEEYAIAMINRYGEDVTQHPVGDAELWERTQGGSKFGIGSSDSNFIITGTSSSSGSTPSYAEYQRSQEKVRDLQSQVEDLHNRVEDVQQKMREEVQHHMREEIQHQVREEMKEEMQRQIAELMKKFGNTGNPTG